MSKMWIKQWFYDKTSDIAKKYNCYIDYAERDDETRMCKVVNDCVSVLVEEFLEESDKAIKVRLRTGDVVGSVKGWTTWIPKSVINKEV